MNIKKQTAKDKSWHDEQGQEVPFNRITPVEKLKEKYSYELAMVALKVSIELENFKALIRGMCTEVFTTVMTEGEQKKVTKGNFTWFNFNGTIKIEVSINESIEFDGLLLEKCKQKLLELVGESVKEDKAFIKELILSAFQSSKGKLDAKKILGLKKHASRIKDKRYHEAMAFLDQAIRRPDSKTYFRVWVKNEHGAYENIDLNFSSVK